MRTEVKAGNLLGLGRGKEISLLVLVSSLTADGFKFHVINGAWNGVFTYPNTLTVVHYSGNTDIPADILFDGPWLHPYGYQNYDEAFQYMAYWLRYPKWIRSTVSKLNVCKVYLHRLQRAFIGASIGFKSAYKTPLGLPIRTVMSTHDDDIPF